MRLSVAALATSALTLFATTSNAATLGPASTTEIGIVNTEAAADFNVSVFPGKASFAGSTNSGVIGDGTVLDYRFFNGTDAGFTNSAGYANGGGGVVGTASAPAANASNSPINFASVWTTTDPGVAFSTTPDFDTSTPNDTMAAAQNVTGSVDISGLSSGTVYFIFGSFVGANNVDLTMSGLGQTDVLSTTGSLDPVGSNNVFWISAFDFSDAELYDTISYTYENVDADGSRARFMGVIVDTPPPPAPEPASLILAALGCVGLMGTRRQRSRA